MSFTPKYEKWRPVSTKWSWLSTLFEVVKKSNQYVDMSPISKFKIKVYLYIENSCKLEGTNINGHKSQPFQRIYQISQKRKTLRNTELNDSGFGNSRIKHNQSKMWRI